MFVRDRLIGLSIILLALAMTGCVKYPSCKTDDHCKEGEYCTESIPKSIVGKHIARQDFPVVGTVVDHLIIFVEFIKFPGKKEHPV